MSEIVYASNWSKPEKASLDLTHDKLSIYPCECIKLMDKMDNRNIVALLATTSVAFITPDLYYESVCLGVSYWPARGQRS